MELHLLERINSVQSLRATASLLSQLADTFDQSASLLSDKRRNAHDHDDLWDTHKAALKVISAIQNGEDEDRAMRRAEYFFNTHPKQLELHVKRLKSRLELENREARDRAIIKLSRKAGWSERKLADRFNLSKTQVRRIIQTKK